MTVSKAVYHFYIVPCPYYEMSVSLCTESGMQKMQVGLVGLELIPMPSFDVYIFLLFSPTFIPLFFSPLLSTTDVSVYLSVTFSFGG